MFEDTQKKINKLAGKKGKISFGDTFTPQFISEHSKFRTIEELFEKSGFKADSEEDIKAIPDNEWETFIVQNTNFNSWKDMQLAARDSFVKKTLG